MKRIRVAAIIPIQNGYAFMHRKNVIKRKDYQDYYTFPGGGLEEGESLEEGTIREIKEEFGIDVKVEKLLFKIHSEKFNQDEYFFLCKYVSGEFGTGTGPEFSNDPAYFEYGEYIPEIIKKEDIKSLTLLPVEIKEKFLTSLENKEF